jgi:hypothetical protein
MQTDSTVKPNHFNGVDCLRESVDGDRLMTETRHEPCTKPTAFLALVDATSDTPAKPQPSARLRFAVPVGEYADFRALGCGLARSARRTHPT